MNLVDKYREFQPINITSYTLFRDHELAEKIVELVCDGYDFGTHSSSEYHRKNMTKSLALQIDDVLWDAENFIESAKDDGLYTDQEEIDKVVDQYVRTMIGTLSVECGTCDERLYIEYDDKNCLRLITESREVKQGRYTQNPPKDNCFEFKVYKLPIRTKTNKFVIANDLRSYVTINDYFDDHDINYHPGTLGAAKDYAEKGNMTVGFVGNTTINVSKMTDGSYAFHESYWDENDSDVEIGENIGRISCGLWWIMGADLKDVDIKKLDSDGYQDYVIIDVEPETDYIFEYDMRHETIEKLGNYAAKHHYKFYKKTL